ncbi:DNA-binding transcriptional LysR family regulator [Bradyrhizobium ottawaense]
MTATLDIATIKAFLLVADLQSFTRAAEALGTTQAAVSLKLQRLETLLGRRLVERSPRAVRLTADGASFLDRARALMAAHDRALSGEAPAAQSLSLGISDHAAGPELVPLLERLHAMSSNLTLAVTIGFSREMQDAYDAGELDAVIVRQEGSRRGGERLTEDEFGWFASRRFTPAEGRSAAARNPRSALRRPRHRRARARQGRLRLARALCRRRRHGGGRSCARGTCDCATGAADRASRAGRYWTRAQAAETRQLEGDATFEGQRSRQACGATRGGGDVSERRGHLMSHKIASNALRSVSCLNTKPRLSALLGSTR